MDSVSINNLLSNCSPNLFLTNPSTSLLITKISQQVINLINPTANLMTYRILIICNRTFLSFKSQIT